MDLKDIHNGLADVLIQYRKAKSFDIYFETTEKFLRKFFESKFESDFIYAYITITDNSVNDDYSQNQFGVNDYFSIRKGSGSLLFSRLIYGSKTDDTYKKIFNRFADSHIILQKRGITDSLSHTLIRQQLSPTLLINTNHSKNRGTLDTTYPWNIIDLCDIECRDEIREIIDGAYEGEIFKFNIEDRDLEKIVADFSLEKSSSYENSVDDFLQNSQLNLNTQKLILPTLEFYNAFSNIIYKINGAPQYHYFIKPLIPASYWNGVLTIGLKRSITFEEYHTVYSIIDVLVRNLFSETIIERAQTLTKDAEWKTIVDEMSHSMKHHFGALQYRSNEKNKAFDYLIKKLDQQKVKYDDKVVEYYKKQSEKVTIINRQLADVNDALFALIKVRGLSENDILSPDVKETLRITKFNLYELIKECLDILSASLELIGFVETEHRENIDKKVIPNLFEVTKKDFACYEINAARKLLSIIVLDLLKNAIRFTDSKIPEVSVYMDEYNQDNYALHFVNNQRMTQKAFDFIKENVDVEHWSKSSKVGIRTIKKILGYKDIGASGEFWKLDVNLKSLEQEYTDIFIVIPKSDIIQ